MSCLFGVPLRTIRFANGQQGIDLIDKDDCRLQYSCHRKQRPHHFLTLPNPLACQTAGADVEKGGIDLAGNRLAKQRLACPRGTKQQQAFWGGPGTLCT